MEDLLKHCHKLECGGHFGANRSTTKVLQSGFYWPTLVKDANAFMVACDRCQRSRNISRRNEMPLNNILEVELFDDGKMVLSVFPEEYFYKGRDLKGY